jgi:hypothetical protein
MRRHRASGTTGWAWSYARSLLSMSGRRDEVLHQCQAIAYADVPIADRRGSQLFDLLHERGFCFGALLPGTAASEAIRMQRLSGTSMAPWATVTASSRGRALLEWISREYERTAAD